MTINIREARVGDYLVTPAGKKRIFEVLSDGLDFETSAGGRTYFNFKWLEEFGFTVEREEPEWHEHENLGYALECVRRGEEVEGARGYDKWSPLKMVDHAELHYRYGSLPWQPVRDLCAWTRFRTRSAPSSEVLAEVDAEVWCGDLRPPNSVHVLAASEAVGPVVAPDGTRVKVQVVKA